MQGAKSSSHVPKFGNWDTDDVPYTICFENASELRAAGLTFDPNDPDTYPPELFAPATTNQKSTPADRRRHRAQAGAHDGGKHSQHDHQRPREGGAIATSSGSEKLNSERSGSDYALLVKERKQSRRKRSSENGAEGIGRSAPAVAGHGGNPKIGRGIEGEMVASVPKFGSWDARDPRSGDGYTGVFNKVKIEKQIAASKPAAVPPPLMNQTKQPIAHTNTTTATTTHGFSSFASKICCCLCRK